MKKILIIADSMGMPRGEVEYENTWIFKLKQKFRDCDFIDKSRRASTTDRLVTEGGGYKGIECGADLLEHYYPDVILTQIGITDCSPRLVNKKSLLTKVVAVSPKIIQNGYFNLVRRFSVRNPKNADVSLDKYILNWKNFLDRTQNLNVKVITVLIAPVTDLFLSKSPFINESISNYNNALMDLQNSYSNLVCCHPFESNVKFEEIALDELHFNSEGHDLVYEKLKGLL